MRMGKRLDAWKRLIFKKVTEPSDQKETESSAKEDTEDSWEDETEKEEKEAEGLAEKKDKGKAAEDQKEKKEKAKEAEVEDEIEKDEKEKETEAEAEKEEKEKEVENEAEKDEKAKEADVEAEKEDIEKEAEDEAKKDEKEKEAEDKAKKDEKEKEAENEAEKDDKEKEEKENKEDKEKEKGAGKGEAKKDEDDKQKLRDGRKFKRDLDSLKAGEKEKDSGKDKGHGRAADKAERALAGEVLKHMLEYEQLNETPGNRVLNELVGSGKTDELVKVISATDKFQAAHKKTDQKNDAQQKDRPTAPAEQQQGLQPVSAVQTAQYLTEALRLAREHEKNKKREEKQKEKLGYKDLLAMEDLAHGKKPKEQRIVKRPVKELKLADSAEAGKTQTQNLEPPAMGPKLPSRRKKPNQDPNQQ